MNQRPLFSLKYAFFVASSKNCNIEFEIFSPSPVDPFRSVSLLGKNLFATKYLIYDPCCFIFRPL